MYHSISTKTVQQGPDGEIEEPLAPELPVAVAAGGEVQARAEEVAATAGMLVQAAMPGPGSDGDGPGGGEARGIVTPRPLLRSAAHSYMERALLHRENGRPARLVPARLLATRWILAPTVPD
ncbi:uncharacterized protein PV09_04126 [Verruconis gallopava]|uniref:Uncharacterized protein n=1 Tax=Verruconis gallopava TaxID=253628 RepID=A0A0D2ADE0_9PEZI|nr:uncharacterized protein PV09_04126 [Verruconis gallopava]KIW04963.1 hypothetical protein PV09_04126 [Verruconis gallopava]